MGLENGFKEVLFVVFSLNDENLEGRSSSPMVKCFQENKRIEKCLNDDVCLKETFFVFSAEVYVLIDNKSFYAVTKCLHQQLQHILPQRKLF